MIELITDSLYINKYT